jgi:hypothetical protein
MQIPINLKRASASLNNTEEKAPPLTADRLPLKAKKGMPIGIPLTINHFNRFG